MKKLAVLLSLCALCLCAALPLSACVSGSSPSFAELVANPARYNGCDIVVEGYYFSGFEIVALAGELAPASRPGNVTPVQPRIWIKTSVSIDPESRLYLQQNTPSGYDEHYGRVRLKAALSTAVAMVT
jgi:hypothetical protein